MRKSKPYESGNLVFQFYSGRWQGMCYVGITGFTYVVHTMANTKTASINEAIDRVIDELNKAKIK